MPARLLGAKRGTGGQAEVFLLREVKGAPASPYLDESLTESANQQAIWEVLVRPGKRLKPGSGAIVDFTDKQGNVALSAEIVDWASAKTDAAAAGESADANNAEASAAKGERIARLTTTLPSLDEALHAVGHTPLPPYIKNYAGDEELYQTVYSRRESSAAAPTAGLHFTPELIERLKAKGVRWETVDLEVGLDTFRIVDEDDPTKHKMHTEYYTVPQKTVDAINETHAAGGRVIAVGTTSTRSLESAWDASAAGGKGAITARNRDTTSLYLLPGSTFHVTKSTLMMLVSAFSSRENIMNAYHHAIENRYRMLSFGDAMFIKPQE